MPEGYAEFDTIEDGSIAYLGEEETPSVGINKIRDLMIAGDAPVSDIMRLIALEIVEVMAAMTDNSHGLLKKSQKDLNDQIKGLRELQKTLTEAEIFSKRDSLNMDGPKFQYVFGELVMMFGQAMTDAGLDKESRDSVNKHLGDIIRSKDATLRRELKKMEGTGK